jgi:hypothetical protein
MKEDTDTREASYKEPVDLRSLLKKEMNAINLLLDDDLRDIDHPVHEIRKFIKTVLAVLLLYKSKQNNAVYLHWKSYFKAISKQYAALREAKINLLIFYRLEKKFKPSNKNRITEIRNHFEEKYNLLANDNLQIEKIIRQLNFSIIHASMAFSQTMANAGSEALRKKHKKTIHKAEQLFKTLTLASPAGNFHQFRKWMNNVYFQRLALKRAELEIVNKKQNKQIRKHTAYLGDEHDLQLFRIYLKEHFEDQMTEIEIIISKKIKKLRTKIFSLYPLIKNL